MASKKITGAVVRMYRMGTGDCFVIKFLAGEDPKFTMMIDCGTWSGSKDHLSPYIENLKAYVDNHVDLLVVTHEHKDHVHVFDVCEELFINDFTVDRIWMGWTENDKTAKVKQWQKSYGEKKKALSLAAERLKKAVTDPAFVNSLANEHNGAKIVEGKNFFANVVAGLDELQSQPLNDGKYVGGLAGMNVVKEKIADSNIEFFGPGDIIQDLPQLEGIRFFVLGPPSSIEEIKAESGGKGDSYDHNKVLAQSDAFAAAILSRDSEISVTPFDDFYLSCSDIDHTCVSYGSQNAAWRKIENDWLFSAGSLALRMRSLTNNLSLALAIEFEESGKVMLFPGDAEYGSWKSWHTIDWQAPCRNGKGHLTEDLLSRTVFYKVAHHLSHNGTAQRLGLDMMTDPELTSMATLDYTVISNGWASTMPNRSLLKDLVHKTKGRLMVMNTDQLFFDIGNTVALADQITRERKKMNNTEAKKFEASSETNDLYLQFTVDGKKSEKQQ